MTEGSGEEGLSGCCAKLQPCPGLDLVVLGGRKGLGELLAAEVKVFVLGGHSAQKGFFSSIILETGLVPL